MSESYDKSEADRTYAGIGVSKAPYPLKDKFVNLADSYLDRIVRATFHLGPGIEWRWPEPGEMIYDRTDGYVGVWLEHLRSGWNTRCHQFIKHLFKYIYKISIMQGTPNGVKSITWFLACCDKMGYHPILKLFH